MIGLRKLLFGKDKSGVHLDINPFFLFFRDGNEKEFYDYYTERSLPQFRLTLILGFVFLLTFVFLKALIVETTYESWLIRLLVLFPAFIVLFVLSYSNFFKRNFQVILAIGIAIIGNVAVLINILDRVDNQFHVISGIIVIIFSYTISKARFVYASIGGILICFGYLIYSSVLIDPHPVYFLLNNYFIISTNFLAMGACYFIEYSARRDFILQKQLRIEQDNSRVLNEELESRVSKRTHDYLLLNKQLSNEIEEKDILSRILAEREDLFRSVAESSHEGIAIIDDNFKIIYVNEEAARISGFTIDECINKDFRQFIDPEEMQRTEDRYRARLQGEVISKRNEIRIVTKGGGRRPVFMNSTSVKNINGRIHTITTILDVTELKKLTSLIKEYEKKFETAFINSPHALCFIDLNTGKYLDVNNRFSQLTGFDREKLVGYTTKEYNLWKNAGDKIAFFDKLRGENEVKSFETSFNTNNNNSFEAIVSARLLKIGESDCVFLVIRDISKRRLMEKALRDSEQKYRHIVDNSLEAIFVIKGNKLIFYNQMFLNFTRFSNQELSAKNVVELVNYEERSMFENFIELALEERGNGSVIEAQFLNKHAYKRWLRIKGIRITWDAKEALLCFAEDITENKYAYDALIESEERNRKLVDNANDGILLMDTEKFLDCNEKALDIFNCSREDLLLCSPVDFSPAFQPDGRQSSTKARELIERAIDSIPQFFYWKHNKKTGELFDAEISLNSIELKGEVFLQVIIRDITQRLSAEEETRKSELKYRNIFQTSPDIIALVDKQGCIIEINDRISEWFELSPKEITGRRFNDLDIFSDYTEKKIESQFDDYLHGRIAGNYELELITKSGEIKYGSLISRAIRNENGNVMQYLLVISDITERKVSEQKIIELNTELEIRVNERTDSLKSAMDQLKSEILIRRKAEDELLQAKEEITQAFEKEKKLNELKTRFISMISHEYRTPLTVIMTSTFLLEELINKNDIEQIKKYMSKIRASVKTMTNLLEEVLHVGKTDSGEINVHSTAFDLVKIIDELIEESQVVDRAKHKFTFEKNEEKYLINTDQKLLKQVLRNIYSNTIKYSSAETIISTRIYESKGCLNIEINDEGIGIPEDDKSRIFEPFHRGKNVGTISGTGLGMAIVKRNLELIGARLDISSEQSRGTTFKLLLPKDFRKL